MEILWTLWTLWKHYEYYEYYVWPLWQKSGFADDVHLITCQCQSPKTHFVEFKKCLYNTNWCSTLGQSSESLSGSSHAWNFTCDSWALITLCDTYVIVLSELAVTGVSPLLSSSHHLTRCMPPLSSPFSCLFDIKSLSYHLINSCKSKFSSSIPSLPSPITDSFAYYSECVFNLPCWFSFFVAFVQYLNSISFTKSQAVAQISWLIPCVPLVIAWLGLSSC